MSIAILCLCVCLPIYADGGLVFCGFRAASIHDVATFCLTFFMLANLLDSICIFGPPPKKKYFTFTILYTMLESKKKYSHPISRWDSTWLSHGSHDPMIFSCVPWLSHVDFWTTFISDHCRPLWPATQPVGGIFPKCSWCESVT